MEDTVSRCSKSESRRSPSAESQSNRNVEVDSAWKPPQLSDKEGREEMSKRWKKPRGNVLNAEPNVSQSPDSGPVKDLKSLRLRNKKDVENMDQTTSSFTETSWNTVTAGHSSSGCLKVRTLAESLSQPMDIASKSKDRRSVTWSKVEFHCYRITLGDNPSVSFGPPVAIGSHVVESQVLRIDEYEEHRPLRRHSSSLLLPYMTREAWLKQEGFSRSDFKRVEDEIRMIKKYRKANSVDGPWGRLLSTLQVFYKCNAKSKSSYPP